jgi:hypothetical protein
MPPIAAINNNTTAIVPVAIVKKKARYSNNHHHGKYIRVSRPKNKVKKEALYDKKDNESANSLLYDNKINNGYNNSTVTTLNNGNPRTKNDSTFTCEDIDSLSETTTVTQVLLPHQIKMHLLKLLIGFSKTLNMHRIYFKCISDNL